MYLFFLLFSYTHFKWYTNFYIQGYFEVFSKMECAFRKKLEVLNRRSPSSWSEQEFEYIRKAISYDLPFQQPVYSETKLQPVDMAAHLQVLGESMNKMANTLQQQVAKSFQF